MRIEHEIDSNEMLFRTVTWQRGEKSFHWHEKVEIVQCMEGNFEALIDGVNYKVNKGDILVISERIIHRFNVTVDSLKVRLAQLSYKVILNHNSMPNHVKPFITREEIASSEGLCQTLENIFAVMEANGDYTKEKKHSFAECMYAGLYLLLGEHFPTSHYSKTKKKEKQDFYEVVKYVNEHFKEDITVQSVAATLYTDRGRLARIFLKYAGVSLNEYINTLRLGEALKLIDAGYKITDAALESGFQTVRTFSNVYKKYKKEK